MVCVACELLASTKQCGNCMCVLPLHHSQSLFAVLSADVKQKLNKPTVVMVRLEVARQTVSWLRDPSKLGPPLPLFRYYLLFWVSDYRSNWSAWPILRTLTLQWKLKPNVYPQETNHLKTRLLSCSCIVLFAEEPCGREHHLVDEMCTCCNFCPRACLEINDFVCRTRISGEWCQSSFDFMCAVSTGVSVRFAFIVFLTQIIFSPSYLTLTCNVS